MSKEDFERVEFIGDLVKYLSFWTPVVTVETKFLEWEEAVCVLRCMCEIPEEVEAVKLPHLGVVPVMGRDRFCWCDDASSLIIYEEEGVYGEDDEGISVKDGVATLDLYIQHCVEGEYEWNEFENKYLVK